MEKGKPKDVFIKEVGTLIYSELSPTLYFVYFQHSLSFLPCGTLLFLCVVRCFEVANASFREKYGFFLPVYLTHLIDMKILLVLLLNGSGWIVKLTAYAITVVMAVEMSCSRNGFIAKISAPN